MTLFEIAGEQIALLQLLQEAAEGNGSGEITDAQADAAIDAWLAESAEAEGVKLDGYYFLIRDQETRASAYQAEKEQWDKRARVATNVAKRLKDRVKKHLELTGRTKAESAKGVKFSIVKNGGVPPLVVDESTPVETIDAKFLTTTVSVNTAAIRDALKAGEEVPFAAFGTTGTRLAIK